MALQNSKPGLLLTNAPVSQPNSGLEIPVGFPCNCATDTYVDNVDSRDAGVAADVTDTRFSYLSHLVLTIGGVATSVYFNADKTPYIFNTTGTGSLAALRARFSEMTAQYFGVGSGVVSQSNAAEAKLDFTVIVDLNKATATSIVANGITTAFS
jgi:hypothetical protein